MTLLWPEFLILLAWLPLLVAAYMWFLRRKRKAALRYSSLALIRAARPKRTGLRRHAPFALFVLALVSLIVALARPSQILPVTSQQKTIILAIDVSRSMAYTDIAPSRLEAAQAAALEFIKNQEADTQIGIVDFNGVAGLLQPPTTRRDQLNTTIRSLSVGPQTAIGEGILTSLKAISKVDPPDDRIIPVTGGSSKLISGGPPGNPKSGYAPEIIVLLTDGANNTGISPLEAAQTAAERGIRVYTIGFGTQFGPSGEVDEYTLRRIAAMTGGKYYSAGSASQLEDVFAGLPTDRFTHQEQQEVGAFFAALGALLAAAAILLGLLWHPLP